MGLRASKTLAWRLSKTRKNRLPQQLLTKAFPRIGVQLYVPLLDLTQGCTRILQKYARQALGEKGAVCSAHWMRSTFATEALEADADMEDVQYTLGHVDIATTKLYDRRRHNPEKAASFFANY